MSSSSVSNESTPVSTGAGIAIAGIWLACTAATVVFALMVFEWGNIETPAEDIDPFAFIIVLLLIASPMIAAASMTRLILNKD